MTKKNIFLILWVCATFWGPLVLKIAGLIEVPWGVIFLPVWVPSVLLLVALAFERRA